MKDMIYEKRIYQSNNAFPISSALMDGDSHFMMHCHRELEILFAKQGAFRVSVDGLETEIPENHILLIPPFATHEILPSKNSRRIAILLDLSLAGSSVWEGGDPEKMEELLRERELCSTCWEENVRAETAGIIDGIFGECAGHRYGWELAVKALSNELMLQALRFYPERKEMASARNLSKIAGILAYIALHYTSDLTLSSCASESGFHPSYLSRYFREHMGITFQEYVKMLRIERAQWLLRNRELSITEVCFGAGFRDIRTFNRLFKACCGISPTEWRRRAGEATAKC